MQGPGDGHDGAGSRVSRSLGAPMMRAVALVGAPLVVLLAYVLSRGLPEPLRMAEVSKLDESLIALAMSALALVSLQAFPLVPRSGLMLNRVFIVCLLLWVVLGTGLVGLAFAMSVSVWHFVPAGIGLFVGSACYARGRTGRAPGPGRVRLARLSLLLLLPGLAYVGTSSAFAAWLRTMHFALAWPGGAIDKNIHYFLAATLLPLLILCRPAGSSRPIIGRLTSVGLLLAVAPVVEMVQRKTGRGFEIADVVAHLWGTAYGLACWVCWCMLVPIRGLGQAPDKLRAAA